MPNDVAMHRQQMCKEILLTVRRNAGYAVAILN
jgi:hypothetical protein